VKLLSAISHFSDLVVVLQNQKSSFGCFFVDYRKLIIYNVYSDLTNINNCMNKYENWYNQITSNGKKYREPGLERHHIIPRSLGGTDDIENITFITPREHFVCHWLLIKIHPAGEGHWKMLNALRMMRAENPNQKRYSTKITSRVYAKLKEEYALLQSEKVKGENNPMFGDKFYRTEEGKLKQSQAIKGFKNPAKRPEVGQKISKSKLGKKREPFSQEWRENLSKAGSGDNNSMYGKTHKESSKELMRQKALGRKQSEETIRKKAEAIRGIKKPKKLCPHCQQHIAVNAYARWHGARCRTRPDK